MTKLLVISDPHITPVGQTIIGLDTHARFTAALDHALTHHPDAAALILLGDLNVSYRKLGPLGQLPNIVYTVHAEPTNTRGTESYDNVVFDRLATSEWTGAAGIVSLQQEFGLSMEQAIDVSDHLPVWAEFDVQEHGAQIPLAALPSVEPTGRGRARLVENPLLRLRGYQREHATLRIHLSSLVGAMNML